ncbi:SDR family oxidoreductase [Actinomadura rupiterrae]|uniref:SDR family oxidoreductase n=1 Tax=Actinomadura rupiterrae TaxID=559627 RepID=UPI0035567F4F
MPTIALVAAGSRLGLSLAKVFGAHGFDVALIARSPERLGELTDRLAAEGGSAAGFPADVTGRPSLVAALNSAEARFGGVDVFHYSAPAVGPVCDTGALDVTADDLRLQVESVCCGAITAARAVLPAMLDAGAGTCCSPPARPRSRPSPCSPVSAWPARPCATGCST